MARSMAAPPRGYSIPNARIECGWEGVVPAAPSQFPPPWRGQEWVDDHNPRGVNAIKHALVTGLNFATFWREVCDLRNIKTSSRTPSLSSPPARGQGWFSAWLHLDRITGRNRHQLDFGSAPSACAVP